jgi:hypothetical protein
MEILVHLVSAMIMSWFAVAVLYGVIAPALSYGVTFWSAFSYALAFPFRAVLALVPRRS